MINGAVKRENMENMFVMAALVAILAWYVAEIVPTRQDTPYSRVTRCGNMSRASRLKEAMSWIR